MSLSLYVNYASDQMNCMPSILITLAHYNTVLPDYIAKLSNQQAIYTLPQGVLLVF